jgi:hypothetical protein
MKFIQKHEYIISKIFLTVAIASTAIVSGLLLYGFITDPREESDLSPHNQCHVVKLIMEDN